MVTLPTDTQILITREFDAPKHLVYKAYTSPESPVSNPRRDAAIAHYDFETGTPSIGSRAPGA